MDAIWALQLFLVFLVHYVDSSDVCTPGLVLNGSSGFFWSPNFPNNFPANSDCTWNIMVPRGKIMKISFLSFTLESGQNEDCAGAPEGNARVYIKNVASDDGKTPFQLCGQKLPNPVYSEGNSVHLRFVSGSTVERGFNASYEAINKDLLCPENMTLHETAGSITSPFYPRLYPDNQTCSWQITAKQGNRVKLEIMDYNIQECDRPNCTCDYLQVLNGFSDDATGKICGVHLKSIAYYSLQESLTVLFVSDSTQSKSYDGFEATYQQLNYSPPICPKEAIPLSGSGKFSSPNYPISNYSASTNCTWNITAPAGKYVKLVFTDFALSSCAASCSSASCSYVELYDGGSANSPLLGRFCRGSTLKETYSSGHQMFLKFRSGQTVDRGFEAMYSVVSTLPTTATPATPTPPTTPTTPISDDASNYIDPNGVQSDRALLHLKKSEFLKNGNRTSYVQIIVIQLKDDSNDIGASTDSKYAAKNINKDYENRVEGEVYITAEFDYEKSVKTFLIGDEMYYTRSAPGSTKYLNGELKSNTWHAVFQRSFDEYRSYDSEKFIHFKTENSFPTVIVVLVILAFVVLVLIAVGVYFCWKRKKKTAFTKVSRTETAEMEEVDPK